MDLLRIWELPPPARSASSTAFGFHYLDLHWWYSSRSPLSWTSHRHAHAPYFPKTLPGRTWFLSAPLYPAFPTSLPVHKFVVYMASADNPANTNIALSTPKPISRCSCFDTDSSHRCPSRRPGQSEYQHMSTTDLVNTAVVAEVVIGKSSQHLAAIGSRSISLSSWIATCSYSIFSAPRFNCQWMVWAAQISGWWAWRSSFDPYVWNLCNSDICYGSSYLSYLVRKYLPSLSDPTCCTFLDLPQLDCPRASSSQDILTLPQSHVSGWTWLVLMYLWHRSLDATLMLISCLGVSRNILIPSQPLWF